MRDKRIDYLGFIGELQKHYAEPAKDAIKHEMGLKKADRAEGELFGGLLTVPATSTIDTTDFIRVCKKLKIPEQRYRQALTVNKKAALEILSGEQLGSISEIRPGSPTLTIRRLIEAPADLVQAVKEISAAIAGQTRNADAA